MSVMNKKIPGWYTLAALAILMSIIAGCTGTAPVQPDTSADEKNSGTPQPVPQNITDMNDTLAVSDANNRFTFDLYNQLAGDRKYAGNNLFFSPFSISSALAITGEGARGKTADEIRSVFYFPQNKTVLRQGYHSVHAAINSKDAGYSLRTANALWVEKTYPFLPEYTSTAERYYGANVTNLDFKTRPEESRVTINTWVGDRTEQKIRDLIPPGMIDPFTRLVITNAIWFKGSWILEFDKNKTTVADFRTAPGKTVRVPMMERTDEKAIYRYTETSDLQMLSMPYEHDTGRQLSMVVLLPKADNLLAAESALDTGTFLALQQSAESKRVKVYFPKYTLKTKYLLSETLPAMGMPTAFSINHANFSGMDSTTDLYIDEVIHQAFVEVNEEGTEAAAATAVVMKATGIRPDPVPVFRADHPFIFLIRDDNSGTILFIGRVVNPSSS